MKINRINRLGWGFKHDKSTYGTGIPLMFWIETLPFSRFKLKIDNVSIFKQIYLIYLADESLTRIPVWISNNLFVRRQILIF